MRQWPQLVRLFSVGMGISDRVGSESLGSMSAVMMASREQINVAIIFSTLRNKSDETMTLVGLTIR